MPIGKLLSADNRTTDRRWKALVISSSSTPSAGGSGAVMCNLLQRFERHEVAVVCSLWVRGLRTIWGKHWPTRVYGMIRVQGGGDRGTRLLQLPLLLVVSLLVALTCGRPVVMVVYPPEEFLLVGYLVSIITRRPLLPYFHDTYLDARPSRFRRWLQSRVFGRAKQVIVMSEGMKGLFAARYPGLACHVLTHSHNAQIPDPEKYTAPPIHAPVRLLVIGNFNGTNRDAASRILSAIGRRQEYSLTVFTAQRAGELARLGLDESLMHMKRVPYEILIPQIMEHDILLHPLGLTSDVSDAEILTAFPTRTIEYLLSCRPILAHVPADSYIGQFYRQHECALVVSRPDPSAIRSALDQLQNDAALRAALVRNALRAAETFHADRVSQVLRALIASTTRGARESDMSQL